VARLAELKRWRGITLDLMAVHVASY
jgi:hypothetical protein